MRFIRSAQQLSFSLVEVAELLKLASGTDVECVDVRRRSEVKRHDVQKKMEDLERIRQALETLIDGCRGKGAARTCSILEAINRGALISIQ